MLTISSERNSDTPSPMSKKTFSYTQRIEILVQPPHNLRVILVWFNIDPNRSRLYNNQFKRTITINNGVLMIMITRIHIIYLTLFFSGPCELCWLITSYDRDVTRFIIKMISYRKTSSLLEFF